MLGLIPIGELPPPNFGDPPLLLMPSDGIVGPPAPPVDPDGGPDGEPPSKDDGLNRPPPLLDWPDPEPAGSVDPKDGLNNGPGCLCGAGGELGPDIIEPEGLPREPSPGFAAAGGAGSFGSCGAMAPELGLFIGLPPNFMLSGFGAGGDGGAGPWGGDMPDFPGGGRLGSRWGGAGGLAGGP